MLRVSIKPLTVGCVAAVASFLCVPALAQSPGCYTPRFSASDEKLREQAVQATEKQYGTSSNQVADALISLAAVYRDMHPEKALIALTRALKIREKNYGTNSEEVASAKLLVADSYEGQTQYATAELLLKESLATREQLFGKSDRRLIPVLYHLSNCYASGTPKRTADALPLIARAWKISDATYGTDSAHSYQLLTMQSAIYRMRREPQLANETDARATNMLKQLKNPFVGSGTAQHLELEPILAAEEAKAADRPRGK